MTKEEGPENPSRSPSSLSDGVDELNKPLIRYKRNPRVLSTNEEVKSSKNSVEDGENRIISSTSSFIKASKDDKPEIIPFKKRSSFITYHDDNDAPQSQLASRESESKLSPIMSADDEHCVEKKTGDENLVVDDGISTKIHDDGGDNKTTGTTPQGGHDYNHNIAPTVVDGDGKQAHDHSTKHDIGDGCLPTDTSVEKSDGNTEVAMKDVVDGNKGDKKQIGYFVSLMMDDGEDVPDQLMELEDDNGNKNGGSGELVGDHEEGQQASMEDDDGGHGNNINNNNTTEGEEKSEGKKPMEIDIPVMIHEGDSSKNSKLTEGGNGAEGEQVHPIDVVTNPEGGGEKGKEIAPALGGDTPCVIAKTNQRTHDEVAQEEDDADNGLSQQARKKFKSGSDEIIGSSNAVPGPNGGVGRAEPQVRPPAVQQAANRPIRLFGIDISPCEQEHHVPIILRDGWRSGNNQATGGAAATGGVAGDGSRPTMQHVIRLFGVDISGDQVQPAAATGNGDGGSSSNRLPGSDGGHGR